MNKTTKIKTVLISIAGGFMILSALLYFLTPLLGEVSFDSFAAFGGGVVTLFTFDFHHPYFFPVFAFCVIAFVLNIWWVVVLLLKAQKYHFHRFHRYHQWPQEVRLGDHRPRMSAARHDPVS